MWTFRFLAARIMPALTLLILGLAAGCGRRAVSTPAHEHDGADHGHADDAHELEPVRVTAFTPRVELFLEYPPLIADQPATLLAHFTVLATGEPVREGALSVQLSGADGARMTFRAEAPARDGLFKPEVVLGAPGRYAGRVFLHSLQADETIELDEIVVHADRHAAEHAAEAAGEAEPANAIPYLMEQQWKLGMRLEQAERRTLTKRLPVPGQVEAPSGHAAVVSVPLAGRLQRAAGGGWPRIGERVEAGQVLALVEPPLPITEAAQLSANRAQLASVEIDLLIRSAEVQRAIAQAKARLGYATRTLQRGQALQAKGIGTEQQLDEAQQAYDLALAEHEAALAVQAQYEEIRRRVDELRGSSPEASDRPGTPYPAQALLLPVISPIAGEIVSIAHMEGEHVEAQHEIFRVVNLEHVWVVGQVSEFDLPALPPVPGALLAPSAGPNGEVPPIDVLASGGRLVHVGTVIDPASRSAAIRYELPNREGRFRAGTLVDLFLETQVCADAVAIPYECVVRDNGQPIAFVPIHGELFERRELELGIRDGRFVEVKRGLEAGERVAGRGAYAIHLASQSPAQFGHGHVH